MRDVFGDLADYFAETRKPGYGACLCWSITNVPALPGQSFDFTSHDRGITVPVPGRGDVTFSPSGSFSASAVSKREGLNVDNMNVLGVTTEAVTADEVLRGIFDDAELTIYAALWTAPSAGVVVVKRGFLGEAKTRGARDFEVELRGLTERLQRRTGRTQELACDVKRFGDVRCGVDVSQRKLETTVSEVLGSVRIRLSETRAPEANQPAGYFFNGAILWTSGENVNWETEIVGQEGDIVELLERPFYLPVAGDAVTLTQGCPRTRAFCKGIGNLVNYRGFPDMPTVDEQAETPDAS